ncbi:MAG TPA: response regulator transcription factor [Fluviicola sp.]|nr:response regulator transcription factor [Fluviicola sp.]
MGLKKNQTILIIDDEQDIIEFLKYNLEKEGYKVLSATNGVEGIDCAKSNTPDLILLDVMMPKMDGIEVCSLLRNEASLNDTLIVFLTSRYEDYSQVAGYEAGADDYVAKPIRPRLLVSKLEAILRRKKRNANEIQAEITSDSIRINREKFLVFHGEKELQLPKKEFELIELLASKPGKVFTRDYILSHVWGNETVVGERTIDVHIRKLREKLGDSYIRTIKGVGYTFSEI